MWRKIRSNYHLKEILFYIDDKRKLNLIKYNKKFQDIAGLNLINFRRFSGRYIVKEYDIIKEYYSYNDRLLFEGWYSDGKRNGKGREYNEEGQSYLKESIYMVKNGTE